MKHRWWHLGWSRRIGARLWWQFCPSAFNRPLLSTWADGAHRWVSVGWGNGNSDPAWQVDLRLWGDDRG